MIFMKKKIYPTIGSVTSPNWNNCWVSIRRAGINGIKKSPEDEVERVWRNIFMKKQHRDVVKEVWIRTNALQEFHSVDTGLAGSLIKSAKFESD